MQSITYNFTLPILQHGVCGTVIPGHIMSNVNVLKNILLVYTNEQTVLYLTKGQKPVR